MPVRNEGYNGEVIKYDYSPKFTAFEGESKRAKIAGQSSGMGVCLVCDAPCNVEVNKQFRYITPSLLSHMMEVEKTTRERRRILFCNDDSIDDLFKHENDLLCFNEKEIKPMKFSKIRKDLRSMVLITYEWTRSRAYWPNLPTSDKITLLKRCVLYQTIIEPAFLTAKIGYPSKFIMANGMYVSMDKNSDAGWEDEPEISKAMKQNLYIDLMKRVIKDIVEPIRKMDLSVKEFVALKSIVCWKNGGVSEVTEETKKILNRDVEMMLKELHEYYLEQKFNEDIIAERMGNIILLLGSIFSLGLETIESHVKMSFFALWQFDSLVKKLFKET
uniref:NR LBD domain-containing protein n=1 Tax=Rhabditophanes sp. KR3021 TaxID=114890 RepID=A0AC35UDX0_9BILA